MFQVVCKRMLSVSLLSWIQLRYIRPFVSGEMKDKLDKWLIEMKLKVVTEDLLRTPGRDLKLIDAWERPYIVYQVLTTVSYLLDTGRRKKKVVQISTLKEFVRRQNELV